MILIISVFHPLNNFKHTFQFNGYGGSLCSKDPYDKDDEEADGQC